jgi:hypothetical protein
MARWLPLATRVPALALVATLGLLALLHQVTGELVRQGELRRQATAVYWQAHWRCSHLPSASRQQACLAQLRMAPPEAAEAPIRTVLVAAPLR